MTHFPANASTSMSLGSHQSSLNWGLRFVLPILLMVIAVGTALANDTYITVAKNEIGKSHLIKLGLNKSVIIDLPVHAKDVIVSNPNVATAFMKTARRAVIQGNSSGETNVFFLDRNGGNIAVFEISITKGVKNLERTIQRLIPGSSIKVEAVGEGVVLSGWANSPQDADRAQSIAQTFLEGTDKEQITNSAEFSAQLTAGEGSIVNLIRVRGSGQVMLKVTVAEVEREIVKQLGISLNAGITTADITSSLFSNPSLGGVSAVATSDGVSTTANIGDASITATLRALERKGAAKLLAEPVLTSISGRPAEFMAGGEFPMPISVEREDDGGVVVGLERVEFGVKLNFTPVVFSADQIRLDVETSVSDISSQGGYEALGVSLPGTRERKAKTTVELGAGSTLAIAGLIEESTKQQINELPGLADLPILGALFRSRDFIRSETELLILVTPYLAQPGNEQDFVKPSDKIRFAGDAAATFLGQMEERYAVGEKGETQYFEGEVGFIFD